MKENEPLTYEEFVGNSQCIPSIPRYDNFPLRFVDTPQNGNRLRQTEVVLRFKREHPKLEGKLTARITPISSNGLSRERLRPFERELHEAYKIMMSYGFTNARLGVVIDR